VVWRRRLPGGPLAEASHTLAAPGLLLGGMVSAARGLRSRMAKRALALADGMWGALPAPVAARGTRRARSELGELLPAGGQPTAETILRRWAGSRTLASSLVE